MAAQAKVVLVERDLGTWYRSFEETVIGELYSRLATLTTFLDPFGLGQMIRLNRKLIPAYFGASSKEEMRQNARLTYGRHYEGIRRVTPAERLLEFDLKAGWEPLCDFLGKDVQTFHFRVSMRLLS